MASPRLVVLEVRSIQYRMVKLTEESASSEAKTLIPLPFLMQSRELMASSRTFLALLRSVS